MRSRLGGDFDFLGMSLVISFYINQCTYDTTVGSVLQSTAHTLWGPWHSLGTKEVENCGKGKCAKHVKTTVSVPSELALCVLADNRCLIEE